MTDKQFNIANELILESQNRIGGEFADTLEDYKQEIIKMMYEFLIRQND